MTEMCEQHFDFEWKFGMKASRTVVCLEDEFEDQMAVVALPEKYRRRQRTTYRMERYRPSREPLISGSRLRF